MKKVLLVLFIIVLAASLVQAADDIRPKCKKGDRSLLFSFSVASSRSRILIRFFCICTRS